MLEWFDCLLFALRGGSIDFVFENDGGGGGVMQFPVEVLWCANASKGRSNRWSFPPAVEKLLRRECEGKRVLHPFGGRAKFGVRMDIDALVRPDVIADAAIAEYFSATGKSGEVKNSRPATNPSAPGTPRKLHPANISAPSTSSNTTDGKSVTRKPM
jgi:hypothetical protein